MKPPVHARVSNLMWRWYEKPQMYILEAPGDCMIRMPPVLFPDLGWVGSIAIHDHPDNHPPVQFRRG